MSRLLLLARPSLDKAIRSSFVATSGLEWLFPRLRRIGLGICRVAGLRKRVRYQAKQLLAGRRAHDIDITSSRSQQKSGAKVRHRGLKFFAAFGLSMAISGCAYNPPELNAQALANSKDLESLLTGQIKGLRFDEKSRWYGVGQTYDLVVGLADLKKPRLYGEQYCDQQGGHFVTLSTRPAPIPPGQTRDIQLELAKHLGNMFGEFQCEVDGKVRWYLDVSYSDAREVGGIVTGLYATNLFFRHSEPYQYADAKRDEEHGQLELNRLRAEQEAEKQAMLAREVSRKKGERVTNKQIGARVCQDRESNRFNMGDVRLLGTVEQVQGDRIKVFVEAAHYTNVTSVSPDGFSQHWTWADYWEFFPCTFVRH